MVRKAALFASASLFLSSVNAVTYCSADNCLRQLRLNWGDGTSYCRTYVATNDPKVTPNPVTTVVTATRTIFAVLSPNGETGYVTRKPAPYIAPNKRRRDIEELKAREPQPEPVAAPVAAPVVARQALPTWASRCTGAPDRLSSACTCLIGRTLEPETTTRTVTQKTYTPTVTVCRATDTLNLREWGRGDFVDRSASFINFDFDTENPQECCNLCFKSWGCVAYYIHEETGKCGYLRVTSSNSMQTVDGMCRAGLLEVYDPYQNSVVPGPWDLGLCSYLVYSDE